MERASGDLRARAVDCGTVAMLDDETLALEVPVRTDAVANVRHAVADHLAERGVPSMIIDDIELIASELVTNAIIHPRPTRPAAVEVHVRVTEAVELVVANAGSASAIPPVEDWRPVPPAAASGRGLGIVRRLCDAVTVDSSGARTVITCHRRIPDGGGLP